MLMTRASLVARLLLLPVCTILTASSLFAQNISGTILGRIVDATGATVPHAEGEAPVIESNQSSLGHVVTSKVIVDLPIKGRNVFDLAALSPGVEVNPRALGGVPSTGDNSAPLFVYSDISINGGRYRTNDFLLD